MRKRGALSQRTRGSLELFGTYGWAIMGALAALLVLWALVGSPERLIADVCILPPPLHCDDAVLSGTTNTFTLYLRNVLIEDITIREVGLSQANCMGEVDILIPGESSRPVTLTCPALLTAKLRSDINIKYYLHRRDGTTVAKSAMGELVMTPERGIVDISPAPERVEEAPGESSQQDICQLAETGELCGGLNLTYGGAYEQNCCSIFGLCC